MCYLSICNIYNIIYTRQNNVLYKEVTKMKTTTKTARAEIKKILDQGRKVTGEDIIRIMETYGCTVLEIQNATSYWQYRGAGQTYGVF